MKLEDRLRRVSSFLLSEKRDPLYKAIMITFVVIVALYAFIATTYIIVNMLISLFSLF